MGTYFTTTTKTFQPITKLSHQNAEGSRTHQAHEAQRRAGRHRREEGGVEGRVHQAAVGLHQEAQPAGPRTSSTSPPTRRWPRSSATTASAPSAWPSSFPPTSPNFPQPFLLPKKTK